jgi:hypothetical protein
MMASELALAIAKRNKETTETVGALRLANDADAELQEVREVLDGLSTSVIDDGSSVETHWCNPEEDCTDDCQRARQLAERLRVG